MKLIAFGIAALVLNCAKPKGEFPPPPPPPAPDSVTSGIVGGVTGGPGKVVNFDFSRVENRYRPPRPPLPQEAYALEFHGSVEVEVRINELGIPTSVKAVTGPEVLRKYAENYLLKRRFPPHFVNGIAQPTRFIEGLPFDIPQLKSPR